MKKQPSIDVLPIENSSNIMYSKWKANNEGDKVDIRGFSPLVCFRVFMIYIKVASYNMAIILRY